MAEPDNMASYGDRQTLSADGTTTFKKFIGPVRWSLTGSFGGGTAKLQARDPSSTASSGVVVDIAEASATAAVDKVIDFPQGAVNWLATNIASSTTPSLVVWTQDADPNARADNNRL